MSQPTRRSTRATTAEATAETESHLNNNDQTSKKRVKSPKEEEEESKVDVKETDGEDEKKVKKVKKEEGEDNTNNDGSSGAVLDEDTKEPSNTSKIAESGDLPPDSFEKDFERRHGVLERGHIYFVYRPKVEKDEAHSLDDISRLQIILVPSPSSNASASTSTTDTKENDKKNYRLLVVGRKRIPKSGGKHEVLWGKVIGVSNDLSALREKLRARTYDTKTLGERHLVKARIAARGNYIFTSPKSNLDSLPENSKNMSGVYKTYLAYKISVPNELGEVQDELRIEEEGAFTLQIRNPDSKSNNPVVRDPKDNQKPAYPKELKSLFTTKFIPSNPPSLLNYAGSEILMIGSSHSVEENIGKEELKELKEEVEKEQEEFYDGNDENGGEEEEVKEIAAKKALEELGMEEGGVLEALEGHWA